MAPYGKIKADTFVYDNSGSDVEVSLSTIPPGNSPTFTGNITINAQGDIRLADSDSSNYVGFQSPTTVASNVIWTLPAADGSAGQQLSTDGSGALSWSAPTNTAAGDLTGTTLASNVVSSSLTSVSTLSGLTVDGDVVFTGASSNGLWDKSANAFVANVTGDLTGTASSATNATNAVNVTVTDESSDTTCFPLFVTTNTGTLPLKVGTNLTFNSANGMLTASAFAGDGSSLTDLNAGLVTSGTLGTARLGSGTASSSNFLRGDGSWQTVTTTTINNNADNRLITGSATADTLEAEAALTYDGTDLACGGKITDSKGDVRSVPTRTETNAYTLVAADAGKCISADNGVTVPNNVFAAGDVVTIINTSTSDKTITQGSGLTMRNVGDDGNYGNVTVKKYAMCTIIFTHATVCFFSTTAKA